MQSFTIIFSWLLFVLRLFVRYLFQRFISDFGHYRTDTSISFIISRCLTLLLQNNWINILLLHWYLRRRKERERERGWENRQVMLCIAPCLLCIEHFVCAFVTFRSVAFVHDATCCCLPSNGIFQQQMLQHDEHQQLNFKITNAPKSVFSSK